MPKKRNHSEKETKQSKAQKTEAQLTTVAPSTLQFLKDLKENNDRDWFKDNKERYEAALENAMIIVAVVEYQLLQLDNTLDELDPKHCISRIYRDVRFGGLPYKTLFAGMFGRNGKKSSFGHYYFQIAPGDSFIGGGIYDPSSENLARIRAHIAIHGEELKAILSAPRLSECLGRSGLEALLDVEPERKLKKAPKGYSPEHPFIHLLCLKSFVVGYSVSDADVLGDLFVDKIMAVFEALVPFIHFLNDCVQ